MRMPQYRGKGLIKGLIGPMPDTVDKTIFPSIAHIRKLSLRQVTHIPCLFSVSTIPFFKSLGLPCICIVNLFVDRNIAHLVVVLSIILVCCPRGMIYLGNEGMYP